MVFKIWQCGAHKDQRWRIGVGNYSGSLRDANDRENEECPYCIIASLQKQLTEVQDSIKCT